MNLFNGFLFIKEVEPSGKKGTDWQMLSDSCKLDVSQPVRIVDGKPTAQRFEFNCTFLELDESVLEAINTQPKSYKVELVKACGCTISILPLPDGTTALQGNGCEKHPNLARELQRKIAEYARGGTKS